MALALHGEMLHADKHTATQITTVSLQTTQVGEDLQSRYIQTFHVTSTMLDFTIKRFHLTLLGVGNI